MSNEKQMFDDLIEIFDEEYGKRNLITPQNTAEKLNAKGYRKASEVAREIFEVLDKHTENLNYYTGNFEVYYKDYLALKKKYTEGN